MIFLTSSKVKISKVKVTRPLWMAVQVFTCRGYGHIVAAALQAAQLVHYKMITMLTYFTKNVEFVGFV